MKKHVSLTILLILFLFSQKGYGSLTINGSYSGPINGNDVTIPQGSNVEMLGGIIDGSLYVEGTLAVRSGMINSGVPVSTFVEGILNLHGGVLGYDGGFLGIDLSPSGTINIYGHSFSTGSDDINNLTITGYLEDNHFFNLLIWEYYDGDGSDEKGQINFLPEPTTFSLFTFVILPLLCRRKCNLFYGKP